jgi:ubiquinone/menaquinone biosynthesis C-methylase UbiE
LAERIGKGKVALDVGCGHGYVAGYLRMKGIEAFALDINPAVLKENSIKGYFIRGDAMHLPIRNHVLDLIMAFEVVEHLKDPDVALREFHRCLKSRGILPLTTPTPKSPTANYPGHVSIRSRKAWVKALESIGFTTKIVTYKYPVHIFPSRMLNHILGMLLGLYKRYFSVTSTKLLCIKK